MKSKGPKVDPELKAKYEKLVKDNEVLTGSVDEMRAEMLRLKEERDSYLNERDNAQRDLREKNKQFTKIEQELGLTKKDVSRLNNDNIELRRKVEGRDGEMMKLRQSEKLATENEK